MIPIPTRANLLRVLAGVEPQEENDDPGVYASFGLSPSSIEAIEEWKREAASLLEGVEDLTDYHCTTVYSKKSFPCEPATLPDALPDLGWFGHPIGFDIFGEDNGTLVLLVKSAALQRLFKRRQEAGAQYDFPTYRPHVTLCKGFSREHLAKLPEFTKTIRFTTETVDEIDKEKAGAVKGPAKVEARTLKYAKGDNVKLRNGMKAQVQGYKDQRYIVKLETGKRAQVRVGYIIGKFRPRGAATAPAKKAAPKTATKPALAAPVLPKVSKRNKTVDRDAPWPEPVTTANFKGVEAYLAANPWTPPKVNLKQVGPARVGIESELKRMRDLFPLTFGQLKSVGNGKPPKPKAYADYEHEQRRINVHILAKTPQDKLDKAAKEELQPHSGQTFLATQTPEGLVAHEFGHHLDRMVRKEYKHLGLPKEIAKQFDKVRDDIRYDFHEHIRKGTKPGITKYGETNAIEAFAEMFAVAVSGPNKRFGNWNHRNLDALAEVVRQLSAYERGAHAAMKQKGLAK